MGWGDRQEDVQILKRSWAPGQQIDVGAPPGRAMTFAGFPGWRGECN